MRGSQWRKKKKMHNNEPLCRRTLEGAKGACMDRGPLAMYSAASRGFAPIGSSDSENEMIEESSHRSVVSGWRWRQSSTQPFAAWIGCCLEVPGAEAVSSGTGSCCGGDAGRGFVLARTTSSAEARVGVLVAAGPKESDDRQGPPGNRGGI
mmetsp:Transcript_98185/g.286323  ORF Transcript_98185/g.286323 Transcript_98185/m.286323 type:complete len:151 (+) Transcript_98185:243-695(+)